MNSSHCASRCTYCHGLSLRVQVKNCIDQFEKVLDNPHCRFFGNVSVGNDGVQVISIISVVCR